MIAGKVWPTSRLIAQGPDRRARNAKGREFAAQRKSRMPWGMVAFILGHVPLAVLMHGVPVLAKIHSVILLVVGLWYAMHRGGSHKVSVVAAYIVGSEVLWRMCGGGIFWEFGKYAFALVLGVSLWQQKNRSLDSVATCYFLLLLPSAILTLFVSSLGEARTNISFYLSGPLALAIGVSFFRRLWLSPIQLQSLLLALLGPIAGAAAICYKSTFGSDDVFYGAGSSTAAAGGFGPNQVSAALGFGMMAVALCLWTTPSSKLLRIVLLGAFLLFVAQALLTLSRTGIYLAAISCALGAVQLARSPKQRLNLLVGGTVVALACWLVVMPAVTKVSGGAVGERFKNTSGTGREGIVQGDLVVWAHHPLFGAGVGMSRNERTRMGGDRHAAHTEYARLLSEHGLLGLISLALMVYMPLRAFRSTRTVPDKVLAAAAASFGLLFMSVSAMRLTLPALALGLACVRQVRPQAAFKPGQTTRLSNPSGRNMWLLPFRKKFHARNRIHGTG